MSLFTVDELVDGEYAVAAELNAMFNDIAAILNGGILNENVGAAAGITAGKLLPVRTATSVGAIGGSAGDGAHAQLRLASGAEFLGLIYDTTSGHWISPAERVLSSASGGNATATTYTRGAGWVIPYGKAKYDAGLTPEFYVVTYGNVAAGGQTLTVQIGGYDHADGEAEHSGGGVVIPATTVITSTSTTAVYEHSGWVQPTITAANLGKDHINAFVQAKIDPYTATVSYVAEAWMRWVSR